MTKTPIFHHREQIRYVSLPFIYMLCVESLQNAEEYSGGSLDVFLIGSEQNVTLLLDSSPIALWKKNIVKIS